VVAAFTFAGAVVVVALRKIAPERTLRSGIVALAFGVAITLAGAQYQLIWIMLCGTVISGLGFGSVFSGALRSVKLLAQPPRSCRLSMWRDIWRSSFRRCLPDFSRLWSA
jgi:hypothetical protein